MNVTVYGDSILRGVLLENGGYRVNREWEKRLSQRFALDIENRSRFGSTIQKAMALIRRDAGRRRAGYALLEFGGNDCDYDWAAVAAAPAERHDCKTPPEQFTASYHEAVALLRESGRTPLLLTLPPIHSERYLRFICRNGLPRERILAWLGDVEAIARWQETYSEMVKKIAAEEAAEVIDLRAAFARDGRAPEELLCDDGIHPSRRGQALIYQALCERAAAIG